jgi:CheY-like chemotaxis protein
MEVATLSNPQSSNLLWIEDEPAQLTAARGEIEDRGWCVTFARDIVSAARLLSTSRYHALIMDLMVAGDQDGVVRGFAIWSTYRLLCWLGGVPASAKAGVSDQWKELDQIRPMVENCKIPAMIVSAYHSPDVTKAMGITNKARVGVDIRLCSKPIDEVQVAEELLSLMAEAR